jgi:hypothetical protein
MSSSAITGPLLSDVSRSADGSAAAPSWSFQNSPTMGFYRVSANVLGLSTAGVQRMVVDASGRVGIGGTPVAPFEIIRNTTSVSGSDYSNIRLNNQNATGYSGLYFFEGTTQKAGLEVKNDVGALTFATGSTERMRIDASGAISFVTSTNTGSAKAFFIKNAGESGNGRNAFTLDAGNVGNNSSLIAFNKNNGNLWNVFNDTPANNSTDFAIWSSNTGGVTLGSNTATSWSPRSSDIRKKKNFETTQGLAEVLQIEPVKYHFNAEEDSAPKRLGFKAQNLQSLVPEMVFPTGEKAEDGSDYLTITPDYLLPVLVKAIQEQQAMIEDLKAKVAALESK